MRINTNILSLSAQRNLANTTRALSRAMARLASGLRVNSARDDAAGLAIGNGLEAQRRGMLQAVRNMNDARGFLDTADGAMSAQTSIVQRMRELSLQAANGTLSSNDRSYLNAEFQQLLEEFNRISNQTQFNGVKLLDGSFATKALQVGTRKGETINFSLAGSRSQDIFLTESTTTSSTSEGLGTFSARQTLSLGGPFRHTVGDFDGDDDDDFILSAGADVYIYESSGDGSVTETAAYQVGFNILDISSSDLNGDGKLDLVYSSVWTPGYMINVQFGNGNGTFQAATTQISGNTTANLVTADVNGDGKADIVWTDYTDQEISTSLNNGDGTFATRTTMAGPTNPQRISSSDFNGDGKADLVVATRDDYTSIYLGNGNGTYQARTTLGIGSDYISEADVNGDGKIDIITTNTIGETFNTYLGNGNGTFQSALSLSFGDYTNEFGMTDVNGDGRLDAVLGLAGKDYFQILLGNGNGTFAASSTYPSATTARSLFLVDLNDDGFLDTVTQTESDNVLRTYLADTTSTPGTASTTIPATLTLTTQSAAEDALEILTSGMAELNSRRSTIGALQNRLDYAQNNALNLIENISSAKSQLMDVDYAQETAEFARLQILQQAGIAVLGQANLGAQLALKLLQNI